MWQCAMRFFASAMSPFATPACTHGQANCEVEIKYADDLVLRISDNGGGMDPNFADQGKDGHFGIRGMRERADRNRGKLTLVSSPNAGTEVKLVVLGDIIFQPTFGAPGTLFAWLKNWFQRMGQK